MSNSQSKYHKRMWLFSRPLPMGLLVFLLAFSVCFMVIKQRHELQQREAERLSAAMAQSLKARLQQSASYNVPYTLVVDTTGKSGYYFQLSRQKKDGGEREMLVSPKQDFSPYARINFAMKDETWQLAVMPVNVKTFLDRMLVPLSVSFVLSSLIGLFVAYLVNISDRLQKMVWQQTKALEKSETRNRAIVNALPDMAFVVDKEGRIIDYNNPFEQKTPMPGDDFIGKKVDEVMPEDIAQQFQSYLAKALSEKQLLTHSYQVNVEDEARNYEARYISQSNEDILVMVRDITDTTRAEQRIRESEEKYRTLVEQAADAIFIADFSGNILVVNPAATKLSLYTEEELLAMKLHQLVRAEDILVMPFKFDEIATGKTITSERKAVRKDGSVIDVEILAKIIAPDRFLAFVRDITERKKANHEILKSREDLRKLTNYIENVREQERLNIAREIHDELGQQLTVLKMDVSRLGKKINAAEEKCEPEINNILGAINKMVEVVRKISSDLRPGLLDDLGLVAAIEWYCADFNKKTGIQASFTPMLHWENALPKPVSVCLFRVLQESLANVADHAGAKNVEVSLVDRDEQLVLLIEDNGRGFDPEELNDKKNLGIMGMKERVFVIGGIYNIYSTPGKGTVVEVCVPIGSDDFSANSSGHL